MIYLLVTNTVITAINMMQTRPGVVSMIQLNLNQLINAAFAQGMRYVKVMTAKELNIERSVKMTFLQLIHTGMTALTMIKILTGVHSMILILSIL